jgi:2'-5' RNA ligase
MSDEAPQHATQLRNHWYWRPGWREGREFYTFHLTFEGQTELHNLVTHYQNAIRHLPYLDPIPLQWLHLTIQGIGFVDEVQAGELQAIVTAATRRLAEIPTQQLEFHEPIARPEALAFPVMLADSIQSIRCALQDSIAAIWGEPGVPEKNKILDPHLSIAYANSDVSSAELVAILRGIEPEVELAPVSANTASLIALQRTGHLYRWTTLAKISLTQGGSN